MTKITTDANKGKTTKHAAPYVAIPEYGLPKFEMPKFDMPNMEMPEAFREMAEKGVEHTKEACAKAKAASEEAADLLENTYEAAVKHATDYNHKLFEIVRTNTGAAIGYANELLGVKSPSEFIELSTSQMRKQFEIVSAQNKELFALTQEMASEAAETIKIGVSKAVNKAI
jgi:phasin